jgi:hypothetical protein
MDARVCVSVCACSGPGGSGGWLGRHPRVGACEALVCCVAACLSPAVHVEACARASFVCRLTYTCACVAFPSGFDVCWGGEGEQALSLSGRGHLEAIAALAADVDAQSPTPSVLVARALARVDDSYRAAEAVMDAQLAIAGLRSELDAVSLEQQELAG